MNTKKIAFLFMAFITAYTSIYTQDTMAPALATEQQISAEQWQQLTDLHEKIMDQTSKIEFCLQTVDQIITNNKIKIDTSKISKSQLLEQIRHIQEMIQSFSQISIAAMQNGSYDIIEQGMSFNEGCIDYLLPIFTNEITSINAENFNAAIMRKFKNFNELTNNTPIEQQIENGQKQIDQLIVASENVGLSIFNKVYRYLDRQPLPISGKSTFSTMYDLGMLSMLGLAAYGMTIYLTPKDLSIPIIDKINNFPGKDRVGTPHLVEHALAPTVKPEDKARIFQEGLGLYGAADFAYQTINKNPLLLASLPLLYAKAYPYYETAYKYSKKKMDNLLAYYGHGDASQNIANQEYVKAYFKDIVGGQELEKEAKLIADYIKNPVRYERQGNSPATGYLLVGPSQTGKSFFARALRTLIDEQFVGTQQKVGFIDVRAIEVEKLGFAQIFEIASSIAPVILFIDELDMYGVRRARNDTRTQELVTAMNGMNTNPNKKVIVIAATNRPEELDFALKEKGRFGNIITFNYPNYESRQHYLKKQLKKYNIALSESMIDTISQETDGKTFNMIDDIIRQARQISTYKLRPVQEQDFEITLDKEIRKIKPNVTMSQVEEELVAIYQAGVAVARYVLPTERKVVKITIDAVEKPMASKEGQDIKTEEKGVQHENAELVQQERIKYNRLGYVFTSSAMNHNELLDDAEQEKEMIALLSGQAALELIKGKTFNSFGKEDRAKVLDYLEKKISQGTQVTNEIRQQAIKAKDILYLQAKATLQPYIKFIKTVADILTKQRAINKVEWAQLTSTLQKSAAVAAPKIIPARLQNKRPLAVARG
jgi:ATP-dependent Zn protease